MIDIEEKINEKIKKIHATQTSKEKKVFNYKGNAEKKTENIVKILNLEDFDEKIHYILFDIIKNVFMKSKRVVVKKICCYNEGNSISLEGVMDEDEKNYFISNIIFKISDIKLVRIQSDDINIDGKSVNLAGETMFCIASDNKLSGVIYETGDEYIDDIVEAKEKDMKLLEKILFTKIVDKDKRIRFSLEMGKLFIR